MLIGLHDSDVSLHQIVQAIVTVLAVINPVVCRSILLTLTPRLLPEQRRRACNVYAGFRSTDLTGFSVWAGGTRITQNIMNVYKSQGVSITTRKKLTLRRKLSQTHSLMPKVITATFASDVDR